MARNISPRDVPNRVKATTQEIGGHEDAKFATKVIEILNGTNFQEHIVPVLNAGVTDYWLPIPSHTMMPPELDFPPCQAILNSQWSVLERSYELNRSHIPLGTEAMSEKDGKRFPKSLTYKRYLGRGGAGIVVEVQAAGGISYAVKRFPREAKFLEAKGQLRSIKEEIEILKKINHTHCIKFMGSYGDVDDIGVVMDPVADCNLESFLITFNHSEPNNRMMLANFFGCLASALTYLHWEINIRHKDIKPQNILVKKDRVILTDFGISLDWSEQGHSTTQEEARRSPKYCAPEAVGDQPRNRKSDIWSLGCVFLEMSAVLRRFPSNYVGTILKDRGCENFRDCLEGIHHAISALRARGASDNYNPMELGWVEQMLQLENKKRWNSKELQLAILQSRSNPPFCGICCNRLEPTWQSRIPTDGTHRRGETRPAETAAARTTERARLYDNKTMKWHGVNVTRDNSVSGAWISKRVVVLYQLEIRQMSQRAILNVGGQQFVADTAVGVTFASDTVNETETADCWVIPASFDLLIGKPN